VNIMPFDTASKQRTGFDPVRCLLFLTAFLGLFQVLPPRALAEETLASKIAKLPVLPEHPSGYKRSLFPHWDTLVNGCSVRETVLISESTTTPVRLPRTCAVVKGTWSSPYDGTVHTDPTKLDIDHVVALKEAWDSGAWSWSTAKRRQFANDLTDPRSLIAVSAVSNREKSDKDPTAWLPRSAYRCTYLEAWVSVKLRWGLAVDKPELSALRTLSGSCSATPSTPAPPTTTPAPPTTSLPTESTPYYPTCTAARAAGAAPLYAGSPGYRAALDRDGDGVACE